MYLHDLPWSVREFPRHSMIIKNKKQTGETLFVFYVWYVVYTFERGAVSQESIHERKAWGISMREGYGGERTSQMFYQRRQLQADSVPINLSNEYVINNTIRDFTVLCIFYPKIRNLFI